MVSISVAMMTECCIEVAMNSKYKVEMSHPSDFVWVFERSRLERRSRAVSVRPSVCHVTEQKDTAVAKVKYPCNVHEYVCVYKYGFQWIDAMYNPGTITVIVISAHRPCIMHPNNKRRVLCIPEIICYLS